MVSFKHIVESVLNEELGISDAVLNGTNELLSLINTMMERTEWKRVGTFREKVFTISSKLSIEQFKIVSSFNIKIIDFTNRDNYVRFYSHLINEFNIKTNEMTLTLPFFDGSIYLNYAKAAINHELEHCLEKYYSSMPETDYYLKASNSIMKVFDKATDEYMLGYYLYFLSKPEINAKCHEFIEDLNSVKPKDKNELIKCAAYNEKELVEKGVRHLYELDEKNIEKSLKMISRSKEKVFKHLFNMVDYMNKKFMKVYQKYVNGVPLHENNMVHPEPPFKPIIR